MPDPFQDYDEDTEVTESAEIESAEINVDHTYAIPPVAAAPSSIMENNHYRTYHPNHPQDYGAGENLLACMDRDKHASIRNNTNLYFSFVSRSEWELADWLSSGALSLKEVDTFLQLDHVSTPIWYA